MKFLSVRSVVQALIIIRFAPNSPPSSKALSKLRGSQSSVIRANSISKTLMPVVFRAIFVASIICLSIGDCLNSPGTFIGINRGLTAS